MIDGEYKNMQDNIGINFEPACLKRTPRLQAGARPETTEPSMIEKKRKLSEPRPAPNSS